MKANTSWFKRTCIAAAVTYAAVMLTVILTPKDSVAGNVAALAFVFALSTVVFVVATIIARAIQGRFHWYHITFAVAATIAFPLDVVFFSPPYEGVPGLTKQQAYDLYPWFFYIANGIAALHLTYMIWDAYKANNSSYQIGPGTGQE